MMLKQIKNRLSKWKWQERKVIRGMKNRDKTFYVIRRNSKSVGLFSYVLTALGHMKTAEERGYIPVVDMKNYITPYLDEIKRIIEACPTKHFYEPQAYGSKLCDIKRLIKQDKNIVFG